MENNKSEKLSSLKIEEIKEEKQPFLSKKEKKQLTIGVILILFTFLLYLMFASSSKYGMYSVTVFGYQKTELLREYQNVNNIEYKDAFVCFEKDDRPICVSGTVEVMGMD